MLLEIFSLLLLIIFTVEMAVMETLGPLFPSLSVVAAGLLDATMVGLLLTPPLWIFFFKGLDVENHVTSRKESTRRKTRLLCVLQGAIFVTQFLVMLILPTALPDLTGHSLAIADACLTILLASPFLWLVLARYQKQFHAGPLTDFLSTPGLLYLILLYMVFLADMLQEVMMPHLLYETLEAYYILIDAIVTTIIIAPFFWLLIIRHLTRTAFTVRARAMAINEQVVDAIVTLDTKGRIATLNPAARTIFNFPESELEGLPAEALFADTTESILPLFTTLEKNNPDNRKRISREMTCKKRDGSTLIMDVSISAILQQGRQEWLLIMRDISERKEAEQKLRNSDARFRQLFEQSDDAMFFLKPETCSIVDVNATCAKLFGYSKQELLSQGLHRLFTSKDFPNIHETIKEISLGVRSSLDNVLALNKQGEEFNLSMRGKLISLRGVNIVLCSFRNITNRIRLEREAKEIQAHLIQTNKMTSLGLMVSGVAHEINNPNNFIMANSRLLSDSWQDSRKILREYYEENGEFYLGAIPFSEVDEQVPKLFDGIVDGAGRINEIISSLKNFYRPDLPLSESSVDINVIAKAAVSLLQHELVKFTENFQMNLTEELPTVKGNRQQLGQVLINLLMNACQALTDKKHGIYLETGYDPESGEVTLTVRDEGRGMSAKDSQRIMEPFYTTKLDTGGTGLGLSISRSIIKEHRGLLVFNSKPGEGSTFVVRLPANMPAAKD